MHSTFLVQLYNIIFFNLSGQDLRLYKVAILWEWQYFKTLQNVENICLSTNNMIYAQERGSCYVVKLHVLKIRKP